MKEWILLTVAALLCWGVAAFLPKLTHANPITFLFYQSFGGLFLSTGILYFTENTINISIEEKILACSTGFLSLLGSLCFLYSLAEGGKVSVVASVTALYPNVTIFIACNFLNESLSVQQMIGVGCAMLAIILILL